MSYLFIRQGNQEFGPIFFLVMIVIWVILLFIGYRLIRSGAKTRKTWKVILGVIFTGLIGLVYYLVLRERIKDQENKERFEVLKTKLSEKKEKQVESTSSNNKE